MLIDINKENLFCVPAKVKRSLAQHYAEELYAGNIDFFLDFLIYMNIWSYAIHTRYGVLSAVQEYDESRMQQNEYPTQQE